MTENYLKNYQILGIRPGANWKQLRQAYKKLINTWHPDRFQQDLRQKHLAEEKTKEINQSYKELAEYYRKNGSLPLMESLPEATPAGNSVNSKVSASESRATAQASTVTAASTETVPQGISRRRARVWAGLAVVGAVYFIWQFALWEDGDNTTQEHPVHAPQEMEEPDTAPEKRFTVGSSLGEVYSIQGVPTQTEKDVWHYGSSKVYFSKGKVFRWHESLDNPLHVDILPSLEKDGTRFFGRGSTKAEVLAVQGAPDRDAGSVWDYGLSRVYFEKDRVTGWQEGPLNPLRVRR